MITDGKVDSADMLHSRTAASMILAVMTNPTVVLWVNIWVQLLDSETLQFSKAHFCITRLNLR